MSILNPIFTPSVIPATPSLLAARPAVEPRHWDLDAHIEAVADEGERFTAVAAAGDLQPLVEACPGWDLADLVKHVGMVHLWAAANIVHPSERWLSVDDLSDLAPYWPEYTSAWPADDASIVEWYRSTLTNLLHVLRTTPADHRCLTFLPAPSPMVMWARRQACEIAVHRFDAEAARGRPSYFDREVAADVLDELLCGFAPRMGTDAITGDHVLHVRPNDVAVDFDVAIGPDGIRTIRTRRRPGDRIEAWRGREADLRVEGSAADLALLLWNRPKGPTVSLDGDVGVLDLWRRTGSIRWR